MLAKLLENEQSSFKQVCKWQVNTVCTGERKKLWKEKPQKLTKVFQKISKRSFRKL